MGFAGQKTIYNDFELFAKSTVTKLLCTHDDDNLVIKHLGEIDGHTHQPMESCFHLATKSRMRAPFHFQSIYFPVNIFNAWYTARVTQFTLVVHYPRKKL